MKTPTLLYEDNHILIWNKPAGLAVQTARIAQKDLESISRAHVAGDSRNNERTQAGTGSYIGVVHRLDQPVEGIVLMAKTKEAAAKLSASFNDKSTTKKYLVLTCGSLPDTTGTLTDYLLKGKNNLSSIVKEGTAGAKKASLSYSLAEEGFSHPAFPGEDLSLYEITLHTGRHHQIRVQLSGAGCPIAGDTKYGSSGGPHAPLCLCAASLDFVHPVSGEKMTFAVTPSWLNP